MPFRKTQIGTVAYVCRDYYVMRGAEGTFKINYCGCWYAATPTLRLAKKLFRRYGKNIEGAQPEIID